MAKEESSQLEVKHKLDHLNSMCGKTFEYYEDPIIIFYDSTYTNGECVSRGDLLKAFSAEKAFTTQSSPTEEKKVEKRALKLPFALSDLWVNNPENFLNKVSTAYLLSELQDITVYITDLNKAETKLNLLVLSTKSVEVKPVPTEIQAKLMLPKKEFGRHKLPNNFVYVGTYVNSSPNGFGMSFYGKTNFLFTGELISHDKLDKYYYSSIVTPTYHEIIHLIEKIGLPVSVKKAQQVGLNYAGMWRDGTPYGFGAYYNAKIGVFHGNYDNFEGYSFGIIMQTLYFTEGVFINNELEGEGKYIDSDGSLEGTFLHGRLNGHGIKRSRRTILEGDWIDGVFMNGKKTRKIRSDVDDSWETHVWEGTFVNEKLEGHGTWKIDDVLKYEGEWKDDGFDGEGVYYPAEQMVVSGTFKNDQYNGVMTIHHLGTEEVSTWTMQHRNGPFKYTDVDGVITTGGYLNGVKQGVWTIIYPNGEHELVRYVNDESEPVYKPGNQLNSKVS